MCVHEDHSLVEAMEKLLDYIYDLISEEKVWFYREYKKLLKSKIKELGFIIKDFSPCIYHEKISPMFAPNYHTFIDLKWGNFDIEIALNINKTSNGYIEDMQVGLCKIKKKE